jgi:putative dehydrogenase
MTTVAVLGMGAMGAAIGARLRHGGADVVTCLQGRSAASRERALSAQVRDVPAEQLAGASHLLAIVPPAEAEAVARAWAASTAGTPHPPVYLDCNAVSVETSARIGALVRAAGARYVDACIIGGPGEPAGAGPALYLSGEEPGDLALLAAHGLRARSTGGPAGAASALKMAYAGFNKGLTGLAAAMVLAATRAGAGPALRQEFAESVPHLLRHVGHTLPDMYGKAWRWDFEMRQVAEFAGADDALRRLYEGMADFYAQLGEDWAGERQAAKAIDAFLGRTG